MVTVKAGNVLRLLIPYSGCPTPKVEWHRFDARIAEDTRTHIETRDNRTQLTIRNCQRSDTGKYTITLSNEAGQASAVIHINVVGEFDINLMLLRLLNSHMFNIGTSQFL